MGAFHGKCISQTRLDGKTAVITGCNTGIGKETAKDFFIRGARVIMACRNLEKANAAADDIKHHCADLKNLGEISISKLDLTSLKSIRTCAKNILENEQQIDILVNNAGVMMCPKQKTEDGFEMQFGTNHLGHFLFTLLLLPKIVKSQTARIINVSSRAHTRGHINFDDLNWEKRPYSAINAYAQSKLANILFSRSLVKFLKDNNVSNVNVYSLHPGVIKTELGRYLDDTYFRGARFIASNLMTPFAKTVEQGAQTTIYCAVDEQCANQTGLYYSDCKVTQPCAEALDDNVAQKLWDESIKLVQIQMDKECDISKRV